MSFDITNSDLNQLREITVTGYRTALIEKPVKKRFSKKESSSNLLALVVSCITRNIPETVNMSEKEFNRLQDELDKIISLKQSQN